MKNPSRACLSAAAPSLDAGAALVDTHLPPFDCSDAFYRANGIDPATLIGRPAGTGPNSVIDSRENGPEFNNVRLLQTSRFFTGRP